MAALPGYPGNSQWVGGDLHIHSTWSDGRRSVSQLKDTMKVRGYFFVYLSDGHHTKQPHFCQRRLRKLEAVPEGPGPG